MAIAGLFHLGNMLVHREGWSVCMEVCPHLDRPSELVNALYIHLPADSKALSMLAILTMAMMLKTYVHQTAKCTQCSHAILIKLVWGMPFWQ